MKSIRCLLVAVTFIGFCALPQAAVAQLAPAAPVPQENPASFLPPVKPAPATPTRIPPVPSQLPPAPLASQRALPPGILAFDAESKETILKPGELMATYLFHLTNVSPAELIISRVQPSCGCTTAQLPPMPWKIPAGGTGQIPVTLNAQGKSGVVIKTLTIYTEQGQKSLMLKTTILQPDPKLMTAADRDRNQLLAKTDRQVVFKGDCARCHVEPVIGKVGKDLYLTACGICHEAEHRATMVPDLRNLPNDSNADYWKLMITMGKEGTLMPAFGQALGGPLSDAQIKTLVDYLVANFPAQGTNSRPYLAKPKI
jgi:mono/diheme cytochrome c family protein